MREHYTWGRNALPRSRPTATPQVAILNHGDATLRTANETGDNVPILYNNIIPIIVGDLAPHAAQVSGAGRLSLAIGGHNPSSTTLRSCLRDCMVAWHRFPRTQVAGSRIDHTSCI